MAKANRNSSPTYSLVRFAPLHSLRMGDFFRKAVKNRTDDYHAILFETRLLGQKAVCISGEEAVKMFYDPEKFKRNGAVPKRIQKTLFGENAIQTLDGKEHLHRKALFLSLMGPDAQQHLAQMVRAAWEARIPEWEQKDRIVLFDIQHVKKKTPAG